MKNIKNCQVVIIHKVGEVNKELTLFQNMTAKDAIIWGDRIRELQNQGVDIGFTTGVKINGHHELA